MRAVLRSRLCTVVVDFERVFLTATDLPPDISRGFDVRNRARSHAIHRRPMGSLVGTLARGVDSARRRR